MAVAGTWLRAAADQVDVMYIEYALMVTSWGLVAGTGGDHG